MDLSSLGTPPQLTAVSLREQARRFLRTSVVTGVLEEGRLYSVGEFAQQLGVSATPVREAVFDLAHQGLVEVVRNRGFMVLPLKDQDLDEIFQLRILLEVPAVEALAGRLPAAVADESRDLVARCLTAARASDLAGFLDSDRELHLLLLNAHGNSRLVQIVDRLRDQTRLYGLPGLAASGNLVAAAEEHGRILDAIVEGDAAAVRTQLERHLRHTRGLWATGEREAGGTA
jgi:DNA-binding GntR family transcriptional regulator